MPNGERRVKTDVGEFRVIVRDDTTIDPMTRLETRIGTAIGVGGNRDICVFMTALDGSDTAKLHNVRTRGLACEVSEKKPIRGPSTVHMVQLAFTLLREEVPPVRFVELDDNSEFPCLLEGGKQAGISLALYELAFHQSTWYERHFGAELKNEVLKSLYKKDGFHAPKPPVFDFKHPVLNEELSPLYRRTDTWALFFEELYKLEGKCKLMLPWYKEALTAILGGISFADQVWRIPLTGPLVDYSPVPTKGGSRRTTLRNKTITPSFEYIDDLSKIKYSSRDFKRQGGSSPRESHVSR